MFQNCQNVYIRNKKLKQISLFFRLDLFFDEKGVFRVGGRFQKVVLVYEIKYLIIILKKSYLIEFFIRYYYN